ncbi:hypothetical protein DL98DRAFT_123664 [Cadophora sp. DSE1049]|nr:hypothetical protein DL98DRAFT_123664 [Cadophora sp. DSE1049]
MLIRAVAWRKSWRICEVENQKFPGQLCPCPHPSASSTSQSSPGNFAPCPYSSAFSTDQSSPGNFALCLFCFSTFPASHTLLLCAVSSSRRRQEDRS